MIAVIEEGFLLGCVIRDITIARLRVIGVCRVVPRDGCARLGVGRVVVFRCLHPAFGHSVVTKVGDDRVIAHTCVFRVSVGTFLGRYARSNAQLLVVFLLLRLYLVHALGIVLLAGCDIAAVGAIHIVERASADS